MAHLRPPLPTLLDKHHGASFESMYAAVVKVTGGECEHARASGVARSDDGNLVCSLRLPAELGGPGGGTNPEQLFAAAYAACFHGALSLLAARRNISIHGASVEVKVTLGRDPVDGLFALESDVKIELPGIERSLAQELVRSTERYCPYTKMARSGITSIISLVDAT